MEPTDGDLLEPDYDDVPVDDEAEELDADADHEGTDEQIERALNEVDR